MVEFIDHLGRILLLIVLVKILYFVISEIYINFCGRLFLKSRLKSFGKWAVVTGCTRGVGFEYCRQLASLGIDLILIARNETLVRQQAKDLESHFGIETFVVVCSFDDVSDENMKKLFDVLKDKDIGMLINNAGVMYDYPEYFHNIQYKMLQQLVHVNLVWPQRLSQYVLKEHMLPRKKGLIVFMASGAGKLVTPLLDGYGASKAYIYYLAKCLVPQCADTGVKVQVISPYYIATDMTKYSDLVNKPSLMSPSAETYVKNAIRTFGMTSDTAGYFPHNLQANILGSIPHNAHLFGAYYWQKYLRAHRKET